jgi:hypothetical protein
MPEHCQGVHITREICLSSLAAKQGVKIALPSTFELTIRVNRNIAWSDALRRIWRSATFLGEWGSRLARRACFEILKDIETRLILWIQNSP